jgi:hypothetical protein
VAIYPIRVPRKYYRGKDEVKRFAVAQYNQDAERLEAYLNERIETDPKPVQQYIYGFIALDVGMSTSRVSEILFAVDCGHTGITVAKSA